MRTAFTAHANKIQSSEPPRGISAPYKEDEHDRKRKKDVPVSVGQRLTRLVSANKPQRHPEPWEYDGDEKGV